MHDRERSYTQIDLRTLGGKATSTAHVKSVQWEVDIRALQHEACSGEREGSDAGWRRPNADWGTTRGSIPQLQAIMSLRREPTWTDLD